MFARFSSLMVIAVAQASAAAEKHPLIDPPAPQGAVVGWNSQDGRLLAGELNCTACHAASDAAESYLLSKPAPILTQVGARVTPQYLRKFLAAPHAAKPGTTMPDLLHGQPQAEKTNTVEQLTHYLTSLGGPIEQRGSGASEFQIARGGFLYHRVGCVACHEPFDKPPKLETDSEEAIEGVPAPAARAIDDRRRQSIPLGDLATKTTVDKLAEFLRDPVHVRPGGRMPSLSLQSGEAHMIAAYLLREQVREDEKGYGVGLDWAYYEGKWGNVPDFDKLTPKAEGSAKSFDLKAVELDKRKRKGDFAVRFRGLLQIETPGEYLFWTKSDDGSLLKINGKVVVNNDGTHGPQERQGSVKLDKGRHAIEVGFAQGGGGYELSVFWQPPGAKRKGPIPPGVLYHAARALAPKGIVDFTVDAQKAKAGKAQFAKLGCASCHQVDEKPPAPMSKAAALAKLKLDAADGCLGNRVAADRPKYHLTDKQRRAIVDALSDLRKQNKAPAAKALVSHRMAALNCYACHERGGEGGPSSVRAQYFSTLEPVDWGDEGRLPPTLKDAGAKMSHAGFEAVLLHGEKIRPYMATRMPLFGKANAMPLAEGLKKADAGLIPPHKPAFSNRLIDDGRRLVGKKGLGCINCHVWGEHRLQGAKGLNLLTAPKRLTPEWFHAFVLDPQKHRPRTRMPTGWPNGQSFFPDIQGGDVHKQIDAVWAYLSVGDKGGLPPGMLPGDEYLLTPGEEPIVFRTFLKGVGAHAVTVGFRQRTHFAFDALRVRLAKAWTGDFVSAQPAWQGRAGQYATITSANQLDMPPGSPLAVLADEKASWPVLDRKSHVAPPGWRFRGYRYDEKRVPIFLYTVNDMQAEERIDTEYLRVGSVINRRVKLTAAEGPPKNVYFRAAVGKSIEPAEGGGFKIDDRLTVRFEGGKPFIRDAAGGKELLLPVQWNSKNGKAATAQWEVQYQW